jgi:hypothetical protein
MTSVLERERSAFAVRVLVPRQWLLAFLRVTTSLRRAPAQTVQLPQPIGSLLLGSLAGLRWAPQPRRALSPCWPLVLVGLPPARFRAKARGREPQTSSSDSYSEEGGLARHGQQEHHHQQLPAPFQWRARSPRPLLPGCWCRRLGPSLTFGTSKGRPHAGGISLDTPNPPMG